MKWGSVRRFWKASDISVIDVVDDYSKIHSRRDTEGEEGVFKGAKIVEKESELVHPVLMIKRLLFNSEHAFC